ncbi:hypothetical protein [Chitinimonas naiadis]
MKSRINELFESALIFGLAGLFATALIAELRATPPVPDAGQQTQLAQAAGGRNNG